MKKLIVVAICSSMLGGCVAALPVLAVQGAAAGGSIIGGNAWMKSVMNKQERQAMTAAAIGQNLNPRLIDVSAIKKEGDSVSWTADTAAGRYSCVALKGRTVASCTQI